MSLRHLPSLLLLCLLATLVVASSVAAASAGDNQPHKVLVMNAYHRGFKWTDSITAGIESVLETGQGALQRQVEHVYMDTKRLHSSAYLQKLRDIYRFKFQRHEFDVIIASDNNALDFVVEYRDEIFGQVPVVFCGVNDFEPSMLRGLDGITGVNELPDLEGNIELIQRLHPGLQQLLVIEDDTPTGRRTHGQLLRLLPRYPELDIRLVSQVSMDELQQQVAALPADSAVLYTTFFRDRLGQFYEYDQSASLVAAASRVPVYATWDFSLGFGVIGGKLTDGFSQGEAAARIALRILQGESPASIPVVMETPSRFMFDYQVMERFGLKVETLPAESILLNEPDSRYGSLLLRSGSIITLLLVLLGVVLLNNLRRQRAESAVRRSEGRLRAIYTNNVVGIGVVATDGRYLQMNQAWAEMLRAQQNAASEYCIDEEAVDEERGLRHDSFQLLAAGRIPSYRQERRFRRRDGSLFWGDQSVAPVLDDEGRVTAAVCLTVDVSERKQAEEEIRKLAYYDGLTDLPNRTLFLDRMRLALRQAQRDNGLVGLIFLDLDRFKDVNDNLGHDAGDDLLRQVAHRLTAAVRDTDTVGRLGGDEFVVLLSGLQSRHDAERIATNILRALRDPFSLMEQETHTSSSLGVALFPYDGVSETQLLKHADMAMYAAKEKGRNNFQFFSIDLHQRSSERIQLEVSLRRALNRDEFSLDYQPQYDLRSGKLTGVEALLRWHHPERGLVAPGEFIPLAEETGLIRPIGEWVLRTACAQARAWQQQSGIALRLAVNLSIVQLSQPDLVDVVEQVLRQTQLPPHLLELELTESAFMKGANNAIDILTDLKIRGIALAIDDFGTGYSSLNHLKNFPIDRIKIDRSFVRDVMQDPDDAIIVETIIAMARNLKLDVIAEGVETADQLAFLCQLGCQEAQGFLLGRPQPPAAILQLLRTPPAERAAHLAIVAPCLT